MLQELGLAYSRCSAKDQRRTTAGSCICYEVVKCLALVDPPDQPSTWTHGCHRPPPIATIHVVSEPPDRLRLVRFSLPLGRCESTQFGASNRGHRAHSGQSGRSALSPICPDRTGARPTSGGTRRAPPSRSRSKALESQEEAVGPGFDGVQVPGLSAARYRERSHGGVPPRGRRPSRDRRCGGGRGRPRYQPGVDTCPAAQKFLLRRRAEFMDLSPLMRSRSRVT